VRSSLTGAERPPWRRNVRCSILATDGRLIRKRRLVLYALQLRLKL
jgi:hypothetical protein